MKKGLLLSVVASTMIFAGGDIAPVEPAAAAPVADCSDFYGSVGAYYETNDMEADVAGTPAYYNYGAGTWQATDANDLFDKEASKFDVTAVIGVEKNLFGGIGFGAEVAGWSRISNDIAMNHRSGNFDTKSGGELSQLFLTASFGNTAIRVGRFAIPGSLSPLLRTGTTAGVKDTTYDGLLVANTDLADTTIYGVWAYRAGDRDTFSKIGADETGAFALGVRYTGFANTTVTAVGYYGPDFAAMGSDAIGAALTVNTKYGAYGVDGQVTYVDLDLTGETETITAGLRVSGSFDMFDAWAMVTYINDGTYGATLAGGTGSLLGDAIDHTSGEGFGVGGGVSAKVWMGTAYLNGGYVSYEDGVIRSFGGVSVGANATDQSHAFVAAGYTFKVSDINFKAEYKYSQDEFTTAAPGSTAVEVTGQRVRLEAVYNF